MRAMFLILRIALNYQPSVLKTKLNLAIHSKILLSNSCNSGSGDMGSGQDDNCDVYSRVPSPGPTLYDQRKYGHNLPSNNVNMYFQPLPNIPTGIFRNTDGEVLGFGAGKCCLYKNPEYFLPSYDLLRYACNNEVFETTQS